MNSTVRVASILLFVFVLYIYIEYKYIYYILYNIYLYYIYICDIYFKALSGLFLKCFSKTYASVLLQNEQDFSGNRRHCIISVLFTWPLLVLLFLLQYQTWNTKINTLELPMKIVRRNVIYMLWVIEVQKKQQPKELLIQHHPEGLMHLWDLWLILSDVRWGRREEKHTTRHAQRHNGAVCKRC